MNRDPRREVAPPLDVTKALLDSGYVNIASTLALNSFFMIVLIFSEPDAESAGTRIAGVPTPGKPYQWD